MKQTIKRISTAVSNLISRPTSPVISLDEVFKAEADHTKSRHEQMTKAGVQPETELTGLALSGGGIRSAAFALGIIQELAHRNVLAKFDYVSSVSGGGYIASWLTTWVHREGYQKVEQTLNTIQPNVASPLSHLRKYSNFLTPRSSIFSTDFFALFTLYFRNLFLNWLIIVPLILITVLLAKIVSLGFWWTRYGYVATPQDQAWLLALFVIFVAGFAGSAFAGSVRRRPSVNTQTFQRRTATKLTPNAAQLSARPYIVEYDFFSLLASCICATAATLILLESPVKTRPTTFQFFYSVPVISVFVYASAWIQASFFVRRPPKPTAAATPKPNATKQRRSAGYVVWEGVAFAFAGLIAGLCIAAYLVFLLAYYASPSDLVSLFLVCCTVPVIIFAHFIGEIFYVCLTGWARWSDAQQEWLARAAGYYGRSAFVWFVYFALTLFGALAIMKVHQDASQWTKYIITALGGASGVVTLLLAATGITAAQPGTKAPSKLAAISGLLLPIATVFFVISVVALISLLIDLVLVDGALVSSAVVSNKVFVGIPVLKFALALLVALLIISAVFSWLVNINRYSLHGMYRNRLIRAFLGASNVDRNADPFTDFDENDNVKLSDLRGCLVSDAIPPQLLIINTALNVVSSSSDLSLQERKALPFSATPLHVGSGNLHTEVTNSAGKTMDIWGCYRPTNFYSNDITVGTMMTISGAAASPNMGYNTSPFISVLLTTFNVRLGAWLGNPGKAGDKTFYKSGPTFPPQLLISEALGFANEKRGYVYLSDGGHFENLGLYELVRRGCMSIIVSDAGCDPETAFEDLGNAVRKISIDMDVKITFPKFGIGVTAPAGAIGATTPSLKEFYAVGEIRYPNGKIGKLIYIKPTACDDSPLSSKAYGLAHIAFPHETTNDQWFSESQFEAYRALGQHQMKKIADKTTTPNPSIATIIKNA